MGKQCQLPDSPAVDMKLSTCGRPSGEETVPSLEQQQRDVSESWVDDVRQEPPLRGDRWNGIERRSGVERRSGKDRRLDPARFIPLGMPGERRSGRDRRNHPFYGRSATSPSSENRPS
jgi:hypothetical protein